jgi:glycerophosphoryl diester phosphodiesterase
MSFFKGWDDSPRAPAVHHQVGLPLAGEIMANNVRVGYARDGDYLHVQSFDDLNLEKSLAPGAPITALVERIREGEEVRDAAERLAKRASRYAIKPRPWLTGKINYPPTGIV